MKDYKELFKERIYLEINRVSIIGMGSLGMLFGSFLVDMLGNDHVEFIMDENRKIKFMNRVRKVNGKEYNFHVVSAKDGRDSSDLIIFAVKSTRLNEAIEVVKNKVGENTIIISLLNGITSEQTIGEVFGMEKVLYSVAEGMDPIKTGDDLNYKNMGYLCIGTETLEKGKGERLDRVLQLFDKIGFPYKLEEDVFHRLWSKFMLNVGVNQVVMVYEGTFGTIQKPGPARDLMISAMREVITLAQKEGIGVSEKDLAFYVSLVDTLDPKGMPSMRHDGLHRIKSEVEMFSGMVLKLGKMHGVPTPVNERIYYKIEKIEKDYIAEATLS